jgi:hypothetical protein
MKARNEAKFQAVKDAESYLGGSVEVKHKESPTLVLDTKERSSTFCLQVFSTWCFILISFFITFIFAFSTLIMTLSPEH